MGSLWAKIWGKQSTRDQLASITEKLSSIEEFKRSTQAWQKKVVGSLVLYFSAFYLIAALLAYFKFYLDPRWQGSRLKLITPFAIAPVIVWVTKRLLTWWYHLRLRRNEVKMEELLQAKVRLLEEVMEKETYKVAKELIDKYGTAEQQIRPATRPAAAATPPANKSASELRRRNPPQQRQQLQSSTPEAPARSFSTSPTMASTAVARRASGDHSGPRRLPSTVGLEGRGGGPPLPRPVLPRERGYMDRVVEYLIGDGPSNRYALVCKQCQSHNGMALREEFEYISYRCCYCFYWNPARKQRPSAPRLPTEAERRRRISSSPSESSSDEMTAKALPPALPAQGEGVSSTSHKAQAVAADATETEKAAEGATTEEVVVPGEAEETSSDAKSVDGASTFS